VSDQKSSGVDYKKKESKRKLSSQAAGKIGKTFPTLAHIVLRDGSVVDIPKLPTSTSELTTYDNLRIALEHAGLVICYLRALGSRATPVLADSHNMGPIRMNLEDLMNYLYYAIEGFQSSSGRS